MNIRSLPQSPLLGPIFPCRLFIDICRSCSASVLPSPPAAFSCALPLRLTPGTFLASLTHSAASFIPPPPSSETRLPTHFQEKRLCVPFRVIPLPYFSLKKKGPGRLSGPPSRHNGHRFFPMLTSPPPFAHRAAPPALGGFCDVPLDSTCAPLLLPHFRSQSSL